MSVQGPVTHVKSAGENQGRLPGEGISAEEEAK